MQIKRRLLFTGSIIIATVFLLLAGVSSLQLRWFTPISQQAVVIDIPPGTSATQSLEKLTRVTGFKGHPLDKLIFKRYPQLLDIKSGEYSLPANVDLHGALEILTRGKSKLYPVPLVEGLTYKQWLKQLKANSLIDSQDFSIGDFIGKRNWQPSYMEGRLLPDTYQVARDTDIEVVLNQAANALDRYLAEQWQQRQPGLPYKTPYEALIMASIIEKETGVARERPRISAVFVNRLRLKMRLQTDPTIIYGLGDDFDGDIRRKDIFSKTAYNTYVIDGLPPTPIAMASRAAIHASLHPIESDELYFVGKGDGTHYFSRTLKEHNAAVFEYQIKPNRK